MSQVQDRQDASCFRCQGCGEWRYQWWRQVIRPCDVCGDERGPSRVPLVPTASTDRLSRLYAPRQQ